MIISHTVQRKKNKNKEKTIMLSKEFRRCMYAFIFHATFKKTGWMAFKLGMEFLPPELWKTVLSAIL